MDLIEFIIQKFIQTMGNSRSATNNVEEYLDYNDVVDEQVELCKLSFICPFKTCLA